MRPSSPLLLAGLILSACGSDPDALPVREVALDLQAPTYGAFLGDDPIEVRGQVSDPAAVVRIEGQAVPVGRDGRFATTLPLDGDVEVVDIQVGGERLVPLRRRIPVFSGQPPAETFPGEAPARVTNDGLARVGAGLGAVIDETGWADQLLQALPPLDTDVVRLVPQALDHEPTQVVLSGVEDGLQVGIRLRQVRLTTEATADFPFLGTRTLPLVVTWDEIRITVETTPRVREDGVVVLSAEDASFELGQATFELDGNPLVGLPFLVDAVNALIEPAGAFLVDQILDLLDEVELGGPLSGEADLGGTVLAYDLRAVQGDPEGLALGVALGLDAPPPEGPLRLGAPAASDRARAPVHLVAGLHEGLLDALVGDQVQEQLGEDLDLGSFGALLGPLITNLPGGESAPAGATWCVELAPGPAQVVRLKDGIEPLGILYLPDVLLTFGDASSGTCTPWLTSHLSLEAGLVADGSTVSVDLSVSEAAVMQYGAPAETWTEDEVVDGLTELVGTLTGFVGGQLSFDLAELLGGSLGSDGLLGGVGPLEPAIVDSQPMSGPDGAPQPGLFAISLTLFGPAPGN